MHQPLRLGAHIVVGDQHDVVIVVMRDLLHSAYIQRRLASSVSARA